MGIITTFSCLWVFVMMASMVSARVINKRAAFYIANDTMCIVDGELYFNGDPVPTDDHCEKCTCRPPGFSCVLRDCEVKPGCKAVRKDGECCPDYICGCSHNGNVYKDGDFIRDLQNPCYTCRCHGSSISCTFADCLFRSDCGPEYIQGECCPRYDHCPSLSTTQKTTTTITTVPITYDETTKPLFNLTSPPHERLATHTTIFPTTGTVTAGDGETHTTETYEKPEITVVSSDAVQTTTRGHDSTVTPTPEASTSHVTHADTLTVTTSSESSTSHVTHADTSTVTTFDSKNATETLSEVHEGSSLKPVSLDDETLSTESFSTETTFSVTDVKTDSDAKDLPSSSITIEHTSESDSFSEELHDGQTTEVTYEKQTDEYVTEVSHDRQTDASVTEASHDTQEDEVLTELSHDDKEDVSQTELSSSSQTTELVTDVSHVEQMDESTEELSDESETDHTLHESDGTVSVTFAEDTLKTTVETTEEDESKSITQGIAEILETITDMLTTHEELETTPEYDIRSTHEAFSPLSEVVEGSDGTSPSLTNIVTMAGDTVTELSPVKAFTTTETHYSHNDSVVSDYFTTEVQDTTTEKISENTVASDTSSPSVTLPDDHQTKSEVEEEATHSTSEHSDFGESEFHTIESITKSHSFITGNMDDDDDDSSDESYNDENDISIQDAEELNLFTEAATPSGESQKAVTTVDGHTSHLSSSEATHTASASELTEEESVDATGVTEYHLETEETKYVDSNVGDINNLDHSVSSAEGTTTTEVHPPQHTQFALHSRETTTVNSMHQDSDDNHSETTITDGEENENVEEFKSSLFTEDEIGKDSDVRQSTTENLPDQVQPLSEVVGEVNEDTDQSSSEDHEVPHLLSEGANVPPTDEISTEDEQIQTETENSSKPSIVVTTEGSTETVIIMEAESDLSLTTSEDSSTTSSAEEISITSSKAPEKLSTVSESIRTTHAPETPATHTSFEEASSFGTDKSTSEQVSEDDLSTESEEHELSSEKSHITSTESLEQDKSEFNKNSDIALSTTEIPSDDLDHSEQGTEVSSIISEVHDHETSESSTTFDSDDTSESILAVSSPEESSDVGRNDVSTTTRSSESGTTLKQITEGPKPADEYDGDDDENAATSAISGSDNFSEAEHFDAEKGNILANELNTDSQDSIDDHVTENTSEMTMDAEESIVNDGFESVTDYLHTTENDGSNLISTTQDHDSVSKEDSDTQGHYSIDDEIYSPQNGEHLRTSRSTSSNSMASSITVQYPEKTMQTRHISDNQNENTEASAENSITLSFVSATETIDDDNKSEGESQHIEITSIGETLESTHSTYLLNSAEASSRSFESDEDLSITPKEDDDHESQVTKLVTYEVGKPNGADVDQTEETEDGLKEEERITTTTEISSSTKQTSGLLTDSNVAPDLIVPADHQLHEVPFNSADTENSILSDHGNDATTNHAINPSTTLTPKVTSSTSDLESGDTVNEESSESYDDNHERENDEDTISHFSRTSERYATDEVNAEDDISSNTEYQPTISIHTMDAETEIDYFDDNAENNKEHTNNFLSSEQTSVFPSENGQTPTGADSEEEELIGKDFQGGPEKGGEWFEPTIPVLSAINVQKGKTETPDGIPTTVKYSSSTETKETITLKNEEASHFVSEVVGQTQTSLNGNDANGRDFTNSIDEEVLETKSTINEIPSPTSASYETTYLGTASDSEHDTNSHQSFYTPEPGMALNTNVLTDDEPQANDVEVTVSAKLTFATDEASGSSSVDLNVSPKSELDEQDTEQDESPEQSNVDGVTQKYTVRQDHSDESIRTTTTKTNSVSQGDEIESSTTNEVEHRAAEKYTHLREHQETKEKATSSLQHDDQNVGSETTKESGISINDFMLSDGTGSMMRFTDVITESSDFITHHTITVEPEVVDKEDQLHTNPEQVTNDEDIHPEGRNEENTSEEAATKKVNGNEVTESEQSAEETSDGDFASHKTTETTEHSAPSRDYTEGFKHTNDDDHTTEHSFTSYYKSTTPLPILLFNEFVERVKEDNSVNRNAQPIDEESSTEKPEEIDEILKEIVSDEEIKEDLEEHSEDDHEISAISDPEIRTTTQRNRNEHDLVSQILTSGYDEKQTEIHSSSSQPEEFFSQNSYSTEHSHSDDDLDESEKVTVSTTTSSQVTEQNKKSERNVSRVFVLRKSHDDYQSDEESRQKNEAEKGSVKYSVKSPEIVVDDPNQENHDETVVTTEETAQQNEGSTDDTHHRNFHEGDLDSSPASSSVDTTSTVDADVKDTTAFANDEELKSEPTEVAENSKDEQLKYTGDDVSGPKTTPDSMHSDSA